MRYQYLMNLAPSESLQFPPPPCLLSSEHTQGAYYSPIWHMRATEHAVIVTDATPMTTAASQPKLKESCMHETCNQHDHMLILHIVASRTEYVRRHAVYPAPTSC